MNKDLQLMAAGKGIKQWQIAKEIGVREETLCRWLRKELLPDKKAAILAAIEKLAYERSL
jgi:hypothetical protein